MDKLDRPTILSLARRMTWPCISLYMPTHRSGGAKEQDRVRFRNLLKQAEQELRDTGMRGPDVTAFLAGASSLAEDSAFWREMGDGLAVFVRPEETRALRLDIAVPEMLSVGDRFTIRPLLPALRDGDGFNVLAVSKNRVRLFEADYEHIGQIEMTGAPTSLDDAMKYEDPDHSIQFHSGTPPAPGHSRRSAVFHGHGGSPDVEKDQLVRYLRLVDAGVREALRGSTAPLLVAGVESVVATYREVCSYPEIASTFLAGNPDELTPERIHADAREVLAPYFAARREAVLAELEDHVGTRSVATELTEIIPAAHEGRVRVLFVGRNRDVWGGYDPSEGRVLVHGTRVNGDTDLTELAVAETLLHGGDVHVVSGEVDVVAPAALLRY